MVLHEGFDTAVHVGLLSQATVALPSGTWSIGMTAGTGADWEIGQPLTASSTYPNNGVSLPPANASGAQSYRGAGCAGTIIYGEYYSEWGGRSSYLQTPEVSVAGLQQPTLRFWQCYEIEDAYDGAFLEISTDGGASFRPVPSSALSRGYDGRIDGSWGNPHAGRRAWSGWQGSWERMDVDLRAAAGANAPLDRVVIRFVLSVDRDESRVGWYLDELYIGDRSALP